jgi:hypothetical protein
VDYAALVRNLRVPLIHADLGRVLLDAVAERYERQWPSCSLIQFEQSNATYLFDLASAAGAAQEDRTVAASSPEPRLVGRGQTVPGVGARSGRHVRRLLLCPPPL